MSLIKLYGGHRNQVFKTDGIVKIIWKDGFTRREQIRESVLLENFVATHTDIKARMLVDKSKPIQEEKGALVSHVYYVDGEIRYPWNLVEIASAAKLLTRLHESFKVGPSDSESSDLYQQLHLDFARGNVLFQSGTFDAIGVIDFETTGKGLVEQELGRTLSFLLVDSPFEIQKDSPLDSERTVLKKRMSSFLTNYGLPYRREEVLTWAREYLQNDDYGSLNSVRDEAVLWLKTI